MNDILFGQINLERLSKLYLKMLRIRGRLFADRNILMHILSTFYIISILTTITVYTWKVFPNAEAVIIKVFSFFDQIICYQTVQYEHDDQRCFEIEKWLPWKSVDFCITVVKKRPQQCSLDTIPIRHILFLFNRGL